MLNIVCRTVARFAALYVDDGAKRALVGAAAAGVETSAGAKRALDISLREERHRHALHARQVFHVIVYRREASRGHVSNYRFETLLGFTSEYSDTHVPANVEIHCAAIQHRQASRYMKASDGHSNPSCPERTGDVEGAGILIRLNADKGNTPEIVVASAARQERRDVDACIRLVDDLDININVWPEHPPFGAFGCNAVHSRQRIRVQHCATPPAHHSVVIEVRRLDEDKLKASPRSN